MDELTAKMNSAKGDDKVDAMVALLNEMVGRHKAMHEAMHKKHEATRGGAKMEEKPGGAPLGEHEHSE